MRWAGSPRSWPRWATSRRHAPPSKKPAHYLRVGGDLTSLGLVLGNLADLATRVGDFERADSLLQEALELYRSLGWKHGANNALHNLAFLRFRRGVEAEAMTLARESLLLSQRFGDVRFAILSLSLLGSLFARSAEPEDATRLFGAAEAERLRMGMTLAGTPEGQLQDETLGELRSSLGIEAFDAAFAAGTAMTLEEAVAFAVEQRTNARAAPSRTARRRESSRDAPDGHDATRVEVAARAPRRRAYAPSTSSTKYLSGSTSRSPGGTRGSRGCRTSPRGTPSAGATTLTTADAALGRADQRGGAERRARRTRCAEAATSSEREASRRQLGVEEQAAEREDHDACSANDDQVRARAPPRGRRAPGSGVERSRFRIPNSRRITSVIASPAKRRVRDAVADHPGEQVDRAGTRRSSPSP